MKRFVLAFILLAVVNVCKSQNIDGNWNGLLKIPQGQLRIVFKINKVDSSYTVKMDSPDQGAFGIPASKVLYDNSVLKIEFSSLDIEYSGVFMGDKFIGSFKQSGQTLPMNLSRRANANYKRPQEPLKPYSYYTENVKFVNEKAGITLSGTLSLPSENGVYPVVVLISGSGAQNRDEEVMGHKPFLVLSDYLTKLGIGVLRYDDRGVGESTGVFSDATTMDFTEDAQAAVLFLMGNKNVDKKHIGLIGHSEGAIIAPIVASRLVDNISFVVLMAGPGVKGSEIMLSQQEIIAKKTGVPDKEFSVYKKLNSEIFDLINKEGKNPLLKSLIKDKISTASAGTIPEDIIDQQVKQLTSPWMICFLNYDPVISLSKLKCPILAMYGAKDTQIEPTRNIIALNEIFNKIYNNDVTLRNKYVSIVNLEGLNHLFQECETGLPTEYSTIEQTLSPKALNTISEWILSKIK